MSVAHVRPFLSRCLTAHGLGARCTSGSGRVRVLILVSRVHSPVAQARHTRVAKPASSERARGEKYRIAQASDSTAATRRPVRPSRVPVLRRCQGRHDGCTVDGSRAGSPSASVLRGGGS